MSEVGRRYKIVQQVSVAYLNEGDQCEVIVSPGAGEFWFDGSNILYEDAKSGRVVTTTWTNNFIDSMVEAGRLASV